LNLLPYYKYFYAGYEIHPFFIGKIGVIVPGIEIGE
jgi:hypothetical protein